MGKRGDSLFTWVEANLPGKRDRDPFHYSLHYMEGKSSKIKGLVFALLLTICEQLPVTPDLVETHG